MPMWHRHSCLCSGGSSRRSFQRGPPVLVSSIDCIRGCPRHTNPSSCSLKLTLIGQTPGPMSSPWLLDHMLFGHSSKKCQDLPRIVLAGRFQLTLIGDSNGLAIWGEKCRCGYAFFEAHAEILGDPKVRVHFPDVHIHDLEMLLHVFAYGRLVESVVKSPTIRTPVAAKNDHQQFGGMTGALPCPVEGQSQPYLVERMDPRRQAPAKASELQQI
jgi:hypothetical protein